MFSNLKNNHYDVIIVGGGHAGTEASLAAARMGVSTLLVTHDSDTLGQLSCNPSIGGIGKSHLVKEVDALGGVMAHAADVAGIQFRILNSKKGPAVRSTRAQVDRVLYRQIIRSTLENQPNLSIYQEAIEDLILEDYRAVGVVTQTKQKFFAKAIVITAGTFLNGKVHIGATTYNAGRMGDPASISLASRLRDYGFMVGRLKTGTPARIDGKTIDYTKLEIQPGDTPTPVFSFMGSVDEHPKQISCYIAKTIAKTHEIIHANINQSPLFQGVIEGLGPRYCPSIEDKVTRFKDKTSHQIFVEPEGLYTTEIYPNGISTSLPIEVQRDFIQSIPGFENAHITKPGYAIEYDFYDPRELTVTLETKKIAGLFFAGQINGTTGYEEAAALGLTAGINAALKIQDQEPWVPKRDVSYIGVMIDDLLTQGVKEPYRMFTSRAEHRLLLREDNADLRLTTIGNSLGLINEKRWVRLQEKSLKIETEKQRLQSIWIRPGTQEASNFVAKFQQDVTREYNLASLLKRPNVDYRSLMQVSNAENKVLMTDHKAYEQIEIQTKYAGYIEHQQQEIERVKKYKDIKLPQDLDYNQINGLSTEIKIRLIEIKPYDVDMASRIPGMTPAAISLILVYLRKCKKV
jgi:tRNA uridine 5-carboxymethylaminomethyl modification enzyme